MANNVLEVSIKNDAAVKKSICALLNSNGGKLVLTASNGDKINADKQIRPYEQYFKEKIGTYNLHKYFKILDSLQEYNRVTFVVLRLPTLCTLNTNLYLPTETQISLVSPTEQDALCKILFEQHFVEISEQKVPEQFYYGRKHDRGESKTVQFKNLKTEKKRRNDFVSRAINNKFTEYVSAFANASGGMIYYGIEDDGTVVGELLARGENNREEIPKKLEQAIRKMIWPKESGKIERGKHWNIKFVPVENCNEKRFVIVVSISPCSGGVFTKEPESYYVEDGKVKKMSFETWEKNMYFKVKKILEINRTTCSSQGNENADWNAIEAKFVESLNDTSDINTKLVYLIQMIALQYRQGKLETVQKYLKDVHEITSKTNDACSKRSSALANEPPRFILHAVSVVDEFVKKECSIDKNKDDNDFEGNVQEHVERTKGFCDKALQDLMNLNEDCELELRINITLTLLFLCSASNVLEHKSDIAITPDNLKEAEKYMKNLEQNGTPLAKNHLSFFLNAKSELYLELAERCAKIPTNLVDESGFKDIKMHCKASKRDWKGRDKKQINNEDKSDENLEPVPKKKNRRISV